MAKAYGGLKRIGFSDTKTGFITWLQDAPSPDSALNINTTETESTTGVHYGGQNTQTEIKLLGRKDYNTLETLQISDARKYIHVEFIDGRIYETTFPVNIVVNEDHMFNARDGISTTTFKFTRYTKNSPFKFKAPFDFSTIPGLRLCLLPGQGLTEVDGDVDVWNSQFVDSYAEAPSASERPAVQTPAGNVYSWWGAYFDGLDDRLMLKEANGDALTAGLTTSFMLLKSDGFKTHSDQEMIVFSDFDDRERYGYWGTDSPLSGKYRNFGSPSLRVDGVAENPFGYLDVWNLIYSVNAVQLTTIIDGDITTWTQPQIGGWGDITWGTDMYQGEIIAKLIYDGTLTQQQIETVESELLKLNIASHPLVGFDPASLFANGEVGVWYEPKPEYLQRYIGHTQAGEDGDFVGFMLDKSPNRNHMVQPIAAKRPQRDIDGRPLLFFDGIDDYMESGDLTGNQAWSVCYAIQPEDYTLPQFSVTGGLGARSDAGQQIRVTGSNTLDLYIYEGSARTMIASNQGAAIGTLQIHAFTYDPSTGRSRFWLNGQKLTDQIVSINSVAPVSTPLILGSQNGHAEDSNVKGYYGAAIALTSAIDEPTMEKLIQYVANVSGVEL